MTSWLLDTMVETSVAPTSLETSTVVRVPAATEMVPFGTGPLGVMYVMSTLASLVVLGFWIVLQLFSGLASLGTSASGGVAFFAHIGGFVTGLVLVLLLRRRRWWE